jgi:hypothetical protein
MRRVNLHIARVVLEGFDVPRHKLPALRAALVAELEHAIGQNADRSGVPSIGSSSPFADIDSIRAGDFEAPSRIVLLPARAAPSLAAAIGPPCAARPASRAARGADGPPTPRGGTR